MQRQTDQSKRSGATMVEMAFVVSIFSILLFGIIEYCLIIYTGQIVENAAREGARYAVVNYTDTTMIADTQKVVKDSMYNLDVKMSNYSCTVYLADSTGKSIGNAVDAKFGQYICVDVSVDYVPMTPGLLYLSTFTIRSRSSMGSEAN